MNTEKIKNSFLKVETAIASAESWLLSLWLITMLLLGTLQVVLRNFFDTGLGWGDVFVRCLVLWVGFTGASLATRRNRHINIEIISRLITAKRFASFRIKFVNVVSFLISALLLNASINYTFLEAQNQMTAFLNVPTWVVFIIVPISFSLMTIRLFIHLVLNNTLEEESII